MPISNDNLELFIKKDSEKPVESTSGVKLKEKEDSAEEVPNYRGRAGRPRGRGRGRRGRGGAAADESGHQRKRSNKKISKDNEAAEREATKVDGSMEAIDEEVENPEPNENEESGVYDAKARRLQKNRESARESRLRKKNYMEKQEAKCQALIK